MPWRRKPAGSLRYWSGPVNRECGLQDRFGLLPRTTEKEALWLLRERGHQVQQGHWLMCNLYSITTNQAAIIALFRVINRYVGNLPPMPGVFPDYPAPVVRNAGTNRELTMMRWGMPPPPRAGGFPVTNIRNTSSPHWRAWLKPENRCLV